MSNDNEMLNVRFAEADGHVAPGWEQLTTSITVGEHTATVTVDYPEHQGVTAVLALKAAAEVTPGICEELYRSGDKSMVDFVNGQQ